MDTDIFKTYTLTEQHFKKFKEYFDFWINEFGLKAWEIAYFFKKTEDHDEEDARASVQFDNGARIVVCCLNKRWCGSDPTQHNLSKCAYHEVLELMFGKLNELTRVKCTESDITEELHRVIRILENVHFEFHWSNK